MHTLSGMDNLIKLENYLRASGWYGGTLRMVISHESTFEGFYGLASETWETRVKIEINGVAEGDKVVIPRVIVIGGRFEKINDVAGKVLAQLKK